MQQRLLIPALLLTLGLCACGNKGPLIPAEERSNKPQSGNTQTR